MIEEERIIDPKESTVKSPMDGDVVMRDDPERENDKDESSSGFSSGSSNSEEG